MKVRPAIGIALIVRKSGQILLHKRKGKHAPNTWACPGGHMELWEDFPETALRELKEEAGDLEVTTPVFFAISNTRYYSEKKHYVTIFMICDWISGEPKVMEPRKAASWEWFFYDKLPNPLMMGIDDLKERGLLKTALEEK